MIFVICSSDSYSLCLRRDAARLITARVLRHLAELRSGSAHALILALGLPIIDTVLAIARLLLRALHVVRHAEGSEHYEFFFAGSQAVFTADRAHIHHRLLDLGLTHRNAVLFLYGVAGLFCLGALVVIGQRELNVGLLLGAFGIAAVVGIRRLGYGEIEVLRNGALLPLFDLPLVKRRSAGAAGDSGEPRARNAGKGLYRRRSAKAHARGELLPDLWAGVARRHGAPACV